MANSKYDKYKPEFIRLYCAGEVQTFGEFAKTKGWIKTNCAENGMMGVLGKAWTDEANAKINQISQNLQKKMEEELEITMQEALQVKRKAVALMLNRMKTKGNQLSATELKMIWEVARTEAGQVSRITKSSIGEDPDNPFNTLADVLNAITGGDNPSSTIDEEPAQ